MPEPPVFFEGGESVRKNWPKARFLEDDEYRRSIEAFPRACSDIIAVDPATKSLLLPKRRHHSALGVWCFGGGQKMGETPREAAARVLKHEAGLELVPDDFQFLSCSVIFWALRNPEPQDRGEHSILFTFVFIPNTDERVAISKSLDPEEYEIEHGVRPYSLYDLEALSEPQRVRLVEYWHAVFGEQE